MKNFIMAYLAVRTPLVWVSFLVYLFSSASSIIHIVSLTVWLFTLVFSEFSYERYLDYKGKYREYKYTVHEEEL